MLLPSLLTHSTHGLSSLVSLSYSPCLALLADCSAEERMSKQAVDLVGV
jgi:hypothetical protein